MKEPRHSVWEAATGFLRRVSHGEKGLAPQYSAIARPAKEKDTSPRLRQAALGAGCWPAGREPRALSGGPGLLKLSMAVGLLWPLPPALAPPPTPLLAPPLLRPPPAIMSSSTPLWSRERHLACAATAVRLTSNSDAANSGDDVSASADGKVRSAVHNSNAVRSSGGASSGVGGGANAGGKGDSNPTGHTELE
jgi:hypothetical protein